MGAFETAIDFTLKHQAGTGGIVQNEYDVFLDRMHRKHASVENITDTEIAEIYRFDFWDYLKLDSLPEELAIAIFDFAITTTPVRAVKVLQATLDIMPSGEMDDYSIRAIGKFCSDKKRIADLTKNYLGRRKQYLYVLAGRMKVPKKITDRIAELEKLLLT